jgi:hypothetical protein
MRAAGRCRQATAGTVAMMGDGSMVTTSLSGVRPWAVQAIDPARFRPIVAAPATLR